MMTPEEIETCARAAHEVNRAYCEGLGDTSQRSWDAADEWQRESSREGVEYVLAGSFGAGRSHALWVQSKLDRGWTWGPTKDAAAKTHPDLVPFDALPFSEQAKDVLFVATVRGVATKLGHVFP